MNRLLEHYKLILAIMLLVFAVACGDDDDDTPAPDEENPEEVVTDVTLTFTPDGGGSAITATAQDPDGDGPQDLQVTQNISLVENTTYIMTMDLLNAEDPSDVESITAEIDEEADEHMFFFGWTEGLFGDPQGNGNIDARADAVNYNDQDGAGQPLGLSTTWTTDETGSGTFRVVLKHQPDGIKSATSTASDGDSDIDITFEIEITEDANAPAEENPEEIITDVTLTFTPDDGGDAITAVAQDPDGEGPLGLEIVSNIQLVENTAYTLTMDLLSAEDPNDVESITEEVEEEAEEHMFFFEWTDGLFGDPAGNGNVDSRSDAVNYNDQDANGNPLGLSTSWTTDETGTGTFRVILKHQPDIKSATSTATDGESDIDITWDIEVIADPDAPGEENPEEIITDVTLTFTPDDGGTPITATAQDPDGEGPLSLEVVDEIALSANTAYTLTMDLLNAEDPNNIESITDEIEEEAEEHMFFFEWTADIFSDPTGDGNADNRADPLNYNDQDANGFPLGLSTSWTTGVATSSDGSFRVILKHQPDIKTATSSSTDGESDIDISWTISIQ